MARHAIGLGILALWVWQAGCSTGDPRPVAKPRHRDGGAAELDAGVDAANEPDAAPDAAVRGETPRWPIAEQEIELPYRGAPASVDLEVTAAPGALDLHLNVDTTSSIRFAIDELQSALRVDVISRLRARVMDVAFGVSRFADFPVIPFGNPGHLDVEGIPDDPDRPFVLLTPITTNVDRVVGAVNKLDQPLDFGGDLAEASAEALYQIATGIGYERDGKRLIERGPTRAAVGGGTLGGVGFRDYALHVVLHVADSLTHTPADYELGGLPNVHSMTQASTALQKLGVRVVAILPTVCENDECRMHFDYRAPRSQLESLALGSGAWFAAVSGMCPTGVAQQKLPPLDGRCPLVYDVREDGTGLSRTIGEAVLALLDQVRFGEVHTDTSNDRLGFVREVRTQPVKQPSGVKAPEASDRLPEGALDGISESYVEVERRSLLGFRVTLQNLSIAPRDVPQRYRVAIRIIGDSVLLEERFLRIVVPARAPGEVDPEGLEDGGA